MEVNIGKRNKTKGSNAERYYAKYFREKLGYSHCQTSRLGSRLHDNAGIDLIFIPFNIQIKSGYARGLNIQKELSYVKDKMTELFPKDSAEFKYPVIIIHKKDVGRGKKSTELDELVYMTFSDFCKIINK